MKQKNRRHAEIIKGNSLGSFPLFTFTSLSQLNKFLSRKTLASDNV